MRKMNSFNETVIAKDSSIIADNKPVFGIDLGTTNSAISVVANGGTSKIIELKNGKKTMPSCVLWRNGKFIVGDEAYANREDRNCIYSIKSHMQDPNYVVHLEDNGNEITLSPAEVSAKILRGLVDLAGTMYGTIEDVVVTVPAYFNQIGINMTKKACELAGLNLISISAEPTAAALCYNLDDTVDGSKDVVVTIPRS